MKWLAIAISLIIVSLAQPAWIGFLCPIVAVGGYALFWWGMRQLSKGKARYWLSMAWYTLIYLFQLSWMTSDALQGGYIWAVWAILSLWIGLLFGLLVFFIPSDKPLKLSNVFVLAAAWTLLEWSRTLPLVGAGISFNPLGLTLTESIYSRQMLSFIGIYGLTFWVVLTNALLLYTWEKPKVLKRWAFVGIVAVLPYGIGLGHLAYHNHMKDEAHLSTILIQTGLTPDERSGIGRIGLHPMVQWGEVFEMLSSYQDKHIDLVVLPEALVPYTATESAYPLVTANQWLNASLINWQSDNLTSWIKNVSSQQGSIDVVCNSYFCQAIANALDADLIVGLDHMVDESNYNAALFFRSNENGIRAFYGKRLLLPFGEKVPGAWAHKLCARYGICGSFTAGKGAIVATGKTAMGLSVCYDEMFGNLVRESCTLGATLLVNVTNDGWFPDCKLPIQQFHHARLRTLENGVPMVRSCHTGVTVAIDSLGNTVGQVGDGSIASQREAGALHVQLPLYHYQTLYGLFGDGFILGISAFLIGLFFYQRR